MLRRMGVRTLPRPPLRPAHARIRSVQSPLRIVGGILRRRRHARRSFVLRPDGRPARNRTRRRGIRAESGGHHGPAGRFAHRRTVRHRSQSRLSGSIRRRIDDTELGLRRGPAIPVLRLRHRHRRRDQEDPLPVVLAPVFPLRGIVSHGNHGRIDGLPIGRQGFRLSESLRGGIRIVDVLFHNVVPSHLRPRSAAHDLQHGRKSKVGLQETIRQASPPAQRNRLSRIVHQER
mmetsp:Transcript_25017/g.73236  ORF Transcript_25017/g.73236 Transcript_25017/m.73236 type:complete len:232 (-) Transcript_25017:1128-1823(-)